MVGSCGGGDSSLACLRLGREGAPAPGWLGFPEGRGEEEALVLPRSRRCLGCPGVRSSGKRRKSQELCQFPLMCRLFGGEGGVCRPFLSLPSFFPCFPPP